MSLIRWYRHRPLPSVWDQMEQVARDMARLMPWQEEGGDRPFGVPVDVYETDAEVVVKAELPGVKKEDLDINIQENALLIKAQTKDESEVREDNYYRRELHTGNFFRSVPLPVEVKQDEMRATFENGVLTVRAPKATEQKVGRKIDVE